MSNCKLTTEELVQEYQRIDREHKELTKKLTSEKDNLLNSLHTIRFNACIGMKRQILLTLGERQVKGSDDTSH